MIDLFRFQRKIRSSVMTGRLISLFLVFFFYAAITTVPAGTWHSEIFASPSLSSLSQAGSPLASVLEESETKHTSSKNLLIALPAAFSMASPLSLLWVVVFLYWLHRSRFDRWRLPACPRPPPSRHILLD